MSQNEHKNPQNLETWRNHINHKDDFMDCSDSIMSLHWSLFCWNGGFSKTSSCKSWNTGAVAKSKNTSCDDFPLKYDKRDDRRSRLSVRIQCSNSWPVHLVGQYLEMRGRASAVLFSRNKVFHNFPLHALNSFHRISSKENIETKRKFYNFLNMMIEITTFFLFKI